MYRLSAVCLLWLTLFTGGCGSSDPSAWYQRSIRYYTRAVEAYQRQIQKNPAAEAPRISLADLYIQSKHYAEALEALKTMDSPAARELRAVASFYAGDTVSSLELFERLEKESQDIAPQSLLVYGKVLEGKNLYDQALAVYARITRKPFSEEAAERVNQIQLAVNTLTLDKATAALISEARKKQYPESPAAVILKADEGITITEDNKEITRAHIIILIKEERGKEAFGEIHLDYDATYEKVDLKFARTITEDGNIITVGKKNVRDVSKYLNFPLYSNARVLIVSMPELKVGSVIEYEVETVSSKLIADRHYSYRYALKDKYPIAHASFTVRVPGGRAARYTIINGQYIPGGMDLNPAVTTQQNQKTYRWSFADIPQIMDEPSSSPAAEINPSILISSFADWKEIFTWWDGLYQDKLSLTVPMKALVKELTKDRKTAREKAEALYEFCATQIRYVGIEYGEAGYIPHAAEDIFVNRYGDCKDQAILLTALLRGAGLKAYPVLIPTRDVPNMRNDFPAVLFNHAITAVEIEGSIIFMDTTAEVVGFGDLPAGDQERNVIVFTQGNPLLIATGLTSNNTIRYSMDIRLQNAEDALVERVIAATGLFAAHQRAYFKYTEPYIVEQNIVEKVKNISPFAELSEYRIDADASLRTDPVLEYRFNAPHFLTRAGKMSIMPVLNEVGPKEEWIIQKAREYPLDFNMLQTFTTAVTVHLPRGIGVYYLPQKRSARTDWFDFYVDCTTGVDTIYYTEELRIKKRQVTPGEYRAFKEQIAGVLRALREQIILTEQRK